MSLSQRVRLDLEDGRTVETTYDGRDLRAWETKHRKSALVESMSLGMLTWLGHHAAVRRGELNGELKDYAAFDAVCSSVEGVRADDAEEVEEAADPSVGKRRSKGSPKTRGDGSSAPSP